MPRADLGAARTHLKYIVRDGVTREGAPGRLYDANGDDADGSAFLDRSEKDPHQFRFVVSADEGARLADLKPFIRNLLAQMERDLDTKFDWVAVDHFNTGHPHTHIVIRGRDWSGEELVMARDYISHGARARAQALITLELGPETEVERVQKLFNEVGQERLTRLDRSLIARAKEGILVISAAEEVDPVQRTLRVGRLKTLGADTTLPTPAWISARPRTISATAIRSTRSGTPASPAGGSRGFGADQRPHAFPC